MKATTEHHGRMGFKTLQEIRYQIQQERPLTSAEGALLLAELDRLFAVEDVAERLIAAQRSLAALL